MENKGEKPKDRRPKKPRKKVDNTGATGDKTIYRTKAYTYLEKDGDMIRVPGATPINDVSVVHGPPPPQKLAQINKKAPKPKKIVLSTATVVLLALLAAALIQTSNSFEVTRNNCYKDTHLGKCFWLNPESSSPKECAQCTATDGVEHLIIGTNGMAAKWANLIYVNSTTGRVNTHSAVARLAPAVEGTFLWELIELINIISTEGSLKKVRHHEARIAAVLDSVNKMKHEHSLKFSEFINNVTKHAAEAQQITERQDAEIAKVDSQCKKANAELKAQLDNANNMLTRLDDYVVRQHMMLQDHLTEISRLKESVNKVHKKSEKVEEEMSQLIMDAVTTMWHKRSVGNDEVVSIDYGVSASSIPSILRSRRDVEEGMDIEESKEEQKDDGTVLKIRYGFVDLELKHDVVKNCSCTNGVMKLCNIEVKFNTTKAYKPDESTYCLLNVSTDNGVMTRKERLSCKQSDVRDACTLSLVIGKAIDMANVTLVKIGDGQVFLDDEQYVFKNKLVKDMCEYADMDRPYYLKPTSKYRPIFIMCNVTAKDEIPSRNTNRLHFMVVVCTIVFTIIVETIYQSWVVGLEIATAAILGLILVLEDALISASMQLRNYALIVTVVGCFGVLTMNRAISAAVWIAMLGWLYTVEAIDGMTFTVNGVKGLNKVTYETSLNMHASDTLIMGNVSLTLIEIRQRREYDYVYTMPTVIAMSSLCRNWDCTNTAPNCENKCEGVCGELEYSRCSAMQMYHSCVWSPLACALCEGTGALYEKLCFSGKEVCNLFDSPSNQGDREIVLEYNIDGRTETHVVKVGQDAYSSGGIFKVTQLEILSTSTIGTVAKCGHHTWCRKQKLPVKDFCGWYGMESNSSQMDPDCLRIKNTRAYADGASIQSKIEFRSSNFEPSQFGFRLCTAQEVESEDERAAVVWTLSPGARLNIYHEQELEATTTQLCDDIDALTVSSVQQGEKHAFKTSIVTISGIVEQECLVQVGSKRCYVLGRTDYLLRSDFSINLTMTCTVWGSDTIYLMGNKKYDISASNIAVDPSYYVEKSWSTNTNNTVINGDLPVWAMQWLLNSIRWLTSIFAGIFTNTISLVAIAIICYSAICLKGRERVFAVGFGVVVALFGYVRGEDSQEQEGFDML